LWYIQQLRDFTYGFLTCRQVAEHHQPVLVSEGLHQAAGSSGGGGQFFWLDFLCRVHHFSFYWPGSIDWMHFPSGHHQRNCNLIFPRPLPR
jgi:hypothetical protein